MPDLEYTHCVRWDEIQQPTKAFKTMYSMSNLVFALIIGGGIGGVTGWYLA